MQKCEKMEKYVKHRKQSTYRYPLLLDFQFLYLYL